MDFRLRRMSSFIASGGSAFGFIAVLVLLLLSLQIGQVQGKLIPRSDIMRLAHELLSLIHYGDIQGSLECNQVMSQRYLYILSL